MMEGETLLAYMVKREGDGRCTIEHHFNPGPKPEELDDANHAVRASAEEAWQRQRNDELYFAHAILLDYVRRQLDAAVQPGEAARLLFWMAKEGQPDNLEVATTLPATEPAS